MLKLHLGCGRDHKTSWVNIDRERGDLHIDLGSKLLSDFDDCSVDYIYAQHFIEHLSFKDAVALLKDCKRVLRGHMRLSTPNIEEAVDCYLHRRLERFKEITFKAPAQIIAWFYDGHEHVYDWEDLKRLLIEAGFSDIVRVRRNESQIEELRNLETRPDYNDLIVEVR